MKGNILIGMVFLWLATGCAAGKVGVYSIQMQDVERTPIDGTHEVMFSTAGLASGGTAYIFEDPVLYIRWQISNTQFSFTLKNKSRVPMTIHWDDAYYINPQGDTLRVIHDGIDFARKDSLQGPTILAIGAFLDDFLIPAQHISEDVQNFSSWKINHLFYDKRNSVGDKVSIMLPVEPLCKEPYYYTFRFLVNNWSNKENRKSLLDWLQ